MSLGAIDGIGNPFLKKLGALKGAQQAQGAQQVQGAEGLNKSQGIEGLERSHESTGSNPFAQFKDDGMVGLNIQDGATQTSNGQAGKKKAIMHQLGIA